jgi:hypothetical protein
MATRFYIDPTMQPSITPAFAATWDQTSAMKRRAMSTVAPKNGNSAVTFSDAETNAANLWDVGLLQLISPPLAAQTITGTIAGQFLCAESDLLANDFTEVLVRAASNDGTSFTGTLLAQTIGSLEFVLTTPTNQGFPVVANGTLVSTAVNDGDVLVVEIGYQAQNTSVTSFTGSIVVQHGDLTTDLPVDTSTTTSNNSWIEFSQNLIFRAPTAIGRPSPGTVSNLLATVAGSASTGATLVIPGVRGMRHAITSLHIQRSNSTNAAVTGNATLTITSQNLPGKPSWNVGNAMAAGATQTDVRLRMRYAPLISVIPGADTMIAAPLPGTGVTWTMSATYYLVGGL